MVIRPIIEQANIPFLEPGLHVFFIKNQYGASGLYLGYNRENKIIEQICRVSDVCGL